MATESAAQAYFRRLLATSDKEPAANQWSSISTDSDNQDSWSHVQVACADFWVASRSPPHPDLQSEVDDALARLRSHPEAPLPLLWSNIDPTISVAVEFLPNRSTDVRVFEVAEREYLICLDDGFLEVVTVLCSLSVLRHDLGDRTQWPPGEATGAFNRAGIISDELIRRFLRTYFGTIRVSGGTGLPINVRLSAPHRVIADRAIFAALRFVTFHELAHALASHRPRAASEVWAADVEHDHGIADISLSARDELEADTIAAELVFISALVRGKASEPESPEVVLDEMLMELAGIHSGMYISGMLLNCIVAKLPHSHQHPTERFRWLLESLDHLGFSDVMPLLGAFLREESALTTWYAMTEMEEPVARARHHLLNELPKGGPIDFLVPGGTYCPAGMPSERDVTRLSRMISLAEDDSIYRTRASSVHLARLGELLYGDPLESMPAECLFEYYRSSLDLLADHKELLTPDEGPPDLVEAARFHARCLAGQHWFNYVWAAKQNAKPRESGAGYNFRDLRAYFNRGWPTEAGPRLLHLLDRARYRKLPLYPVSEVEMRWLEELTGLGRAPADE